MNKLFAAVLSVAFLVACGGSLTQNKQKEVRHVPGNVDDYDPKRGEGKFENIQLGAVDEKKAENGEKIYEIKCSSCHKLTDERLVGPGWAGVSKRHQPAWLMNFITNPDAMLDKDPHLMAQLEICLVRMPNQNLTDDEALALVEFMRKNDGIK